MRKRSTKTNMVAPRDNRVRIIAGCWKGRKIHFPDGEGLRPTGDRLRETLFNWLMPVIPGASCLDLFAGSGSLGFEALSRGAAHCVLVDKSPEAYRHLLAAASLLGASKAEIVCAEAASWLNHPAQPFDIVFLDPPFMEGERLLPEILDILQRRQLIAERGWVYLEQPVDQALPQLPGLNLYREQSAGRVKMSLWRSVIAGDQQNAFDA